MVVAAIIRWMNPRDADGVIRMSDLYIANNLVFLRLEVENEIIRQRIFYMYRTTGWLVGYQLVLDERGMNSEK